MFKAVVCAHSPVGREALRGLLETGIEVQTLFAYPQTADESWFEPPAALAKRHGIPMRYEKDFNSDAVYDFIRELKPDLLLSFYFREMIQARFLEIPHLGAFNLHGSLLPKYRGRAPINWVLVKGETETGITLHAMTPKPDDGDIFGQTRLEIEWDETALSLTHKAAKAGRELVKSCVPQILKSMKGVPQKALGPSSYFGGRKPQDSRLDFSMSAQDAFNQIRAVADPWPNAFLETASGILKIPWALPCSTPCPQGHFRADSEGLSLGFSDGSLRVIALKKGDTRSERPSEQGLWLAELGIPQA